MARGREPQHSAAVDNSRGRRLVLRRRADQAILLVQQLEVHRIIRLLDRLHPLGPGQVDHARRRIQPKVASVVLHNGGDAAQQVRRPQMQAVETLAIKVGKAIGTSSQYQLVRVVKREDAVHLQPLLCAEGLVALRIIQHDLVVRVAQPHTTAFALHQ